jgi:hypothetical protein
VPRRRRSRDPIWTLQTGSLFLWKVSSVDLFRSDGLQFFVWDFDKMSHDEVLGWFTVPPSTVYAAKGERIECKLEPPPWNGGRDVVPGHVAVRIRRASEYDKRFMREYLGGSAGPLPAGGEADPDAPAGHDPNHHHPLLQLHPLAGIKNMTKLATESAGGSGNIMSIIRQNTRVVRDRHNLTGTKQVRPRGSRKRARGGCFRSLARSPCFSLALLLSSTGSARGRTRSAPARRRG